MSTTATIITSIMGMPGRCAIVWSVELQHGVLLKRLRRALLRDAHGRHATPLGVGLDLLALEVPQR